ncbi:hypothetical protein JG688_00018551 [Phytophthora aleatoria]|uniref:Probable pectate lyase F n=1 Tax=Phytophthora aleatoria TaxID=2496075 RepID=A0A8J5IW24_9STRA|nr:hypothetical protein JG688_00018551 [Phytophthora aleatoria]
MVNVFSVFTVALAAVTAVASGASMRSEAAPMPTGSWPASKGTVYLKEPYTVKKGQTFDGGMKTYARSNVKCGGQKESGWQTAVFMVEPGATLKNVIIGKDQMEGLYALGVEDEDLQMKLMPVLSAVVPSVERVLENTSFDFAHVVDVNWRLDYVLRSSSAGSVHEPLYFVQLKLQSPHTSDSTLQTVTFSCTVEELRSLVYRIQEAANEVEKLAAGTPSQLRTNA